LQNRTGFLSLFKLFRTLGLDSNKKKKDLDFTDMDIQVFRFFVGSRSFSAFLVLLVPCSDESDAVGFWWSFRIFGNFQGLQLFLGHFGFSTILVSYRYGFKSNFKIWKLTDIGFFFLAFQWIWILFLSVFLSVSR